MARKTSKTPTKIYSYGARLDEGDMATARHILWMAQDYYDDRVRIEQARRLAYREARAQVCPWLRDAEVKIDLLELDLEKVREELKSKRKSEFRRATGTDLATMAKELLALLKPMRKEARAQRKAASADPGVQAEGQRLDLLAKTLLKSCSKYYGAKGLDWRTRGRVDDETRQAFADTASRPWRLGQCKKGFCGRVGGQVLAARGVFLDTDRLFSDWSTVVQIDPLPDHTWDTRSGRRKAITAGRISVGSLGPRRPVWLRFTAVIHRRPPRGIIKNAWLFFRERGGRVEAKFQFTLESEEFLRASPEPVHACAIAMTPSRNLSAAVAVGTDGTIQYLSLPEKVWDRFEFAESIRSAADLAFDEVRPSLVEAGLIPHQSRSRRRARRAAMGYAREALDAKAVWSTWRDERLGDGVDLWDSPDVVTDWAGRKGHDPLAVLCLVWSKKDGHLDRYEDNVRHKARGYRSETYRTWVSALASKYRLFVDPYDAKYLKHAPNPEDDPRIANIERARSRMSLYSLMTTLREKGATEVEADAVEPGAAAHVMRAASVLAKAGEDTTKAVAKIEESRRMVEMARQLDAAE